MSNHPLSWEARLDLIGQPEGYTHLDEFCQCAAIIDRNWDLSMDGRIIIGPNQCSRDSKQAIAVGGETYPLCWQHMKNPEWTYVMDRNGQKVLIRDLRKEDDDGRATPERG